MFHVCMIASSDREEKEEGSIDFSSSKSNSRQISIFFTPFSRRSLALSNLVDSSPFAFLPSFQSRIQREFRFSFSFSLLRFDFDQGVKLRVEFIQLFYIVFILKLTNLIYVIYFA
jgi:hypothetical protein